jgi:hypothetical protein
MQSRRVTHIRVGTWRLGHGRTTTASLLLSWPMWYAVPLHRRLSARAAGTSTVTCDISHDNTRATLTALLPKGKQDYRTLSVDRDNVQRKNNSRDHEVASPRYYNYRNTEGCSTLLTSCNHSKLPVHCYSPTRTYLDVVSSACATTPLSKGSSVSILTQQ